MMIAAFEKVGFCPFTRRCLQDEIIHQEIALSVNQDLPHAPASSPEASY
jgi:hypothetical protein